MTHVFLIEIYGNVDSVWANLDGARKRLEKGKFLKQEGLREIWKSPFGVYAHVVRRKLEE